MWLYYDHVIYVVWTFMNENVKLYITLKKMVFSTKKYQYFSYFFMKTNVVGAYRKRLNEYPQHLFMRRNKNFMDLVPILFRVL